MLGTCSVAEFSWLRVFFAYLGLLQSYAVDPSQWPAHFDCPMTTGGVPGNFYYAWLMIIAEICRSTQSVDLLLILCRDKTEPKSSGIKRSQRVEHGQGNYECTHFYNTSGPCHLVMNDVGNMFDCARGPVCLLHSNSSGLTITGLFAFWSRDNVPFCCLDLPGIGASPPNWTQALSFVGFEDCPVPTQKAAKLEIQSTVGCRHWVAQNTPHNYWDVNNTESTGGFIFNAPIQFSFPNASQNYIFDFPKIHVGEQPASLFAVPGVCNRSCASMSLGRLFN